jgi:hypothetical protein
VVRVLRRVGLALFQAPDLLPHVFRVGIPWHWVNSGHWVLRLLWGLWGGRVALLRRLLLCLI